MLALLCDVDYDILILFLILFLTGLDTKKLLKAENLKPNPGPKYVKGGVVYFQQQILRNNNL